MRYAELRDLDDRDMDVCGIVVERHNGSALVVWANHYNGLKTKFPDFDQALQSLHRSFLIGKLAGKSEVIPAARAENTE